MGYGDPEQVRAEVLQVLEATLPELGLVRAPALRVSMRVRREPPGQPPSIEEAGGMHGWFDDSDTGTGTGSGSGSG